jgi:hypothetical protein
MNEKIQNQRFILRPKDSEEVFSSMLGFLMAWKEKTSIEVIIKSYKKDRSIIQNDFFHGWILRKQIMKQLNDAGIMIVLSDGTERDWNVEDLKAFFKMPFIIDQIHERKSFFANGEEIYEEVHPSKWDKQKFSKYCDLVCQYAFDIWSINVEPPISGHWLSIHKEIIS